MDDLTTTDALLLCGAQRLKGHQRRLFLAEVTLTLCDGNARRAEHRFGWGRETITKGLHELKSGIRCVENFAGRRRTPWEEQDPKRAQDIRDLVEPRTQTDPELKTQRRYTNWSAKEVLKALRTEKGYRAKDLPSERSMRDILNRLGYRLKRIQKGKPLKKTKDTDAIFTNVKAVHETVKDDLHTLEISMDTKAKVNEGDYARGGKNPDRVGRQTHEGLGS
jgi:hypothetical protein